MAKTGYIYKLADKAGEFEEIYVGSTSNLRQRKCQHKEGCNNPNSRCHMFYVYQFIRDNGTFGNWDLYELEEVRYNDKKELLKKEREWIEHLKPKLNKQVPTRTGKEWREANKETINAKYKQHYEEHKDTIRAKQKQYREANKETINAKQNEKHECACGGRFTHVHRARHFKSKKHQDYLSSQSTTANNSDSGSDSD